MKAKLLIIAVALVLFAQGVGFGQTEKTTETADFNFFRGLVYLPKGDLAAEIEYLISLLYGYSEYPEDPNYARVLNNLGLAYHSMGNYIYAEHYHLAAIAMWEKYLEIYPAQDIYPQYAQSLNNLGLLYASMSDYGSAERCYLEAISIKRFYLGDFNADYATSVNNLGALYYAMGDYNRAELYFLEAINIRQYVLGTGHPDYALSVNNMGLVYRRRGDYDNAIRSHLEAIAVRERSLGKEHPDYAQSLNDLGLVYYYQGDYSNAEANFLEAKSIWIQTLEKEHPVYAASENNLGLLYMYIGDYVNAELCHLEAKAIRETIFGKEHPDYVASLNNLYLLYLNTKGYAQALAFKNEAYQLNTGIINRNFSFLSEQQRTAYWDSRSSSFELSYSLSFHYPVPESNRLNYDNALFTKGLLLRTTNAVRDSIYESGDQALISQFNELGRKRQQISALQQSGGNQAYIQTLEGEAEALDKSLTQASATFREFQADLALDWQNVQNSLQTNEAAIEFVSFRIYDKGWTNRTQYAALVLRPGMDAPAWAPLCEETALAELFNDLNGKNPREQAYLLYDEHGDDLYAAVWQPLEQILEGVTTVYYSPSGLLHKVSFNAIPIGGSRLMDKYDLNLVSSTREVVYLRAKTAKTPNSAVVYGGLQYDTDADSMLKEALAYNTSGTRSSAIRAPWDEVDPAEFLHKTGGGTGWGYLRYTATESAGIHELLAANRVDSALFSGTRGNKESFIDLSGKKTAVIHLATHGFFNQDIERNYDEGLRQMEDSNQGAVKDPLVRSGLILSGANTWAQNPVEGAENGILLASEVAGLSLLGAELVVLSACETALGEVDNSEGVFGLQRAFKLAGAETLVMSLWKVDDEATSILINTFYQNWLTGMSKQDSMKAAQRQLRSDPRYASPYYWAAFVLMD